MKTIAVIAEYNPLHNGHLWQFHNIREKFGTCHICVLMSGNFVQRGAPAIVDKFTRTRWALENGADMVLELPLFYATAGAEQFAAGACRLLDSLGIIDYLCFGCEYAELSLLNMIANILTESSSAINIQIQRLLKTGASYAAAREEAVFSLLLKQGFFIQDRELFHQFFSAPNNILAIEYCKALIQLNSSICPYPLPRSKNNYHETAMPNQENCHASASSIRTWFHHNTNAYAAALSPFMPESALHELCTLPRLSEDHISDYLYYALLGKTSEQLSCYYEVSSDLAHRILSLLPKYSTFSSFASLLKSKQYAYSRICRSLLHILLSITKTDLQQNINYLRLLGLKKENSQLLKKAENPIIDPKQKGIPASAKNPLIIITKPSAAKKLLSASQYDLFEKEIAASQLYYYTASHHQGNIQHELSRTPIISDGRRAEKNCQQD